MSIVVSYGCIELGHVFAVPAKAVDRHAQAVDEGEGEEDVLHELGVITSRTIV